ncbi:PSD1 and planctomycete cytochrome C domain-containing protein [Zavarzinella formosa]|uniref:PSD1 and planctomycete cytochrome C domain-containing protein n=1 Tax=Zavarzinella formosa TaxID=360055 RepID=UPI000305A38F|nr:PSD1 and planctomycete cytochrome C domain-containing protein [Zavarzinella formosa]
MHFLTRLALSVMIPLAVVSTAIADDSPQFNTHIRPLFKAYCTECHGESEKPKGGLDLRLRRFVLKGGKGGPSLVVGKPDESLLIEKIRSGEMPPGKKKLTPAEVDLLSKWIATGAKVETDEPATLATGFQIAPEDRQFWAFQPIRRLAVPKVEDHVRTPIDAFLAVKLHDKQMRFSAEADRVTIIRRLTFDLIGLPPTTAEIDAFVADQDSQAYEKLVDRLLASPRYGERWARHWLDVAGYADSEGGSPEDPLRANAWKYRDYVIRAMNKDKPFDQFIREQLAGDELAATPWNLTDPETVEKLTATGFLRMAPDGSGAPGADQKLARNAVVTDTVKIVSSAFLGITVGCAQCHNHRYDPVPQTDFYRLRAFLEPGYDPAAWKPPAARQLSLYTEADRKKAAEIETEAAKIDKDRLAKQQTFIDQTFDKEVAKLPEALREPAKLARKTPEAKRNAEQKKLMQEHPSLNVSAGSLYLYDSKAAAELKKLVEQATEVRKKKPVEEFVRVLTDTPGKLPPTHLHHRGDPDQPKQVVAPGGLTVLDDVLPLPNPQAVPGGSSGRRLALAKWLTDPKHPLTARVIVNRIWMEHFGRGLVGTPGDFGRLGERPTHPELLDWLASEFVSTGWSLKQLHRLILTSVAYRQSSARNAKTDTDPDDRLLGRYPLRRLDAEAVRDASLAVSGKLNLEQFGPPVPVMEDDAGMAVIGKANRDGAGYKLGDESLPTGQESRRSIYVQVRRSKPLVVLDVFDWATIEPNCEARKSSTATPQSLLLLNNEFTLAQAAHFADRVRKEAGTDPRKQVTLAWRLAYGTEPQSIEADKAIAFVASQTNIFESAAPPPPPMKNAAAPTKVKGKGPIEPPPPPPTAAERALTVYCQALLISNRFLYVD